MAGRSVAIAALLVAFSAPSLFGRDCDDQISSLGPRCDGGSQKACDKLAQMIIDHRPGCSLGIVVDHLNDQKTLARLVTETRCDTNNGFLMVDPMILAVQKISDQGLLVEIATRKETSDSDGCQGFAQVEAVKRISKQNVVTDIALDRELPWDVREEAISRMADPLALARIAETETDRKLTDAALANANLTNQAVLERAALILMNDANIMDYRAAGAILSKLKNDEILARLASGAADPTLRVGAAANLSDRAMIENFAGIPDMPTTDAVEAVARIILALKDPIIVAKEPGAHLVVSFGLSGSTSYSSGSGSVSRASARGEIFDLTVQRDAAALSHIQWASVLPTSIFAQHTGEIITIPARADATPMLTQILSRPEFTLEDLRELSHSRISEVHQAAREVLAARK